ncbi:hypothetical protein BSKO_11917 [Bryopsis sp. KO-2023]|nr:hypothetical protein BSKO_11917 [Bryopsis sp. KO-2023]
MIPRPQSHSTAIGPGVTAPSYAVAESFVRPDLSNKHTPSTHLPESGSEAFAVAPEAVPGGNEKKCTQYPYVTGTSVIGLKYDGGVMLACDTLGSYGRTRRYKNVNRIKKVNSVCTIAASGELSDLSYIVELLEEFTNGDFCADDGIELGPKEIHSILARVMYNKRSDFDPLWNNILVAGMQDGEPFLGGVGMIGVHYINDHIATGFGNHLAIPLLREHHRPNLTEQEATALMKSVLQVCYYRDSTAINKYQLGKVSKEGVDISEPFALQVKWDYKSYIAPASFAPGIW